MNGGSGEGGPPNTGTMITGNGLVQGRGEGCEEGRRGRSGVGGVNEGNGGGGLGILNSGFEFLGTFPGLWH